jgi:hypothetical protein
MRRSSSKKNHLFKKNEHIGHNIVVLHFDIICESVDNIEAAQVPYNHIYEYLALNIKSQLCDHVISRQSPHAM